MKLILPFPDSRLFPNRKTDRWTKAEATRDARSMARVLGGQEVWRICQTQTFSTIQKCHMIRTWYPATKKVADEDSLVRATKPLIDGLVDAGILTDDSWDVIIERISRIGPPDKTNPRTEIEILDTDC